VLRGVQSPVVARNERADESGWEIARPPRSESTFEGSDSADATVVQTQRHAGARDFVGTRAVDDDVTISGDLELEAGHFFGGDV
jgi:hypothetical protein